MSGAKDMEVMDEQAAIDHLELVKEACWALANSTMPLLENLAARVLTEVAICETQLPLAIRAGSPDDPSQGLTAEVER